jgi:hypothetical protein
LDANLQAAHSLVQDARTYGEESRNGQARVFKRVPVGFVRDFLARYQVHPDSPDLDTEMLLRYIDSQLGMETPGLTEWSVAVMTGDGKPVELGGLDVGTVIRSRLRDGNFARADIKTLMSKPDRVLDLDVSTADAKAAGEWDLVRMRNDDPILRSQGLLVLYPIDAKSEPVNPGKGAREPLDAMGPVIGIGLVFPGDAEEKSKIKATHVAVDLTDVETEDLDDALNGDEDAA